MKTALHVLLDDINEETRKLEILLEGDSALVFLKEEYEEQSK